VGLNYGTLGGYGVGSGLAGYSGIGLAGYSGIGLLGHGVGGLAGYGGGVLGGLGVAPPPGPVAAPVPSPVLPPPPLYAPSNVIGASVHTTITKQVSIGVTLCEGLFFNQNTILAMVSIDAIRVSCVKKVC
jgi:hypothetical protein